MTKTKTKTLTETRALAEQPALREQTISGYAIVWNSYTTITDGAGRQFREVVRSDAVTNLGSPDIFAHVNHDTRQLPLGRTGSGTLVLTPDNRGLHYDISLPDTERANELRQAVLRGDIDGTSFSFRVLKDKWSSRNGMPIRELLDIEIGEISPVNVPAYSATTIEARSVTNPLRMRQYELMLRELEMR